MDGKVDWDGQHCRFCRCFILCLGRPPLKRRIQGGFAARNNVTLRVMGGKNGNELARNGNDVATFGKVGGKNGKDERRRGRIHAAVPTAAIR